MISNDVWAIIGVNIALFAVFSTMMYWMLNKVDQDIVGTRADLKSLSSRMDGHAMRIDQLYKMFVDLLQARK
jgi:hypothetical protein